MSGAAESPLVSVVVATYNMARYLPRAVASILAQTHANVEVIVIDDGSTDDTPEIAASFTDPRVRVHRQANAGQASAKNKGIELSRGSFIGFLDADDLWLPNKLELQLPRFLKNAAVGIVYSEYECMDADDNRIPKGPTHMRRGKVSGALLIENFVSFPTALVKRECFEKCGVFDLTYGMGIDYDLWLRMSAHYEFDYVEPATVRYRIWGGQMSKNYRKRYDSAIRIMQSFIDKHPSAVDPQVVRTAWAHTYLGRGDCILWQEKDRRTARRDYWRALTFKPGYWPAWRAYLRSFIKMDAPRATD